MRINDYHNGMRRILFFVFIIGVALNGYAQSEFGGKFKAIPPLNMGAKAKKSAAPTIPPRLDFPPIVTPSVYKTPDTFPPKSKTDNSFQIGVAKGISMTPQNKFVNPGAKYEEKLNKKEDNSEGIVYRRNQNLGDFKTKAVSAKVLYRDAEYVDGDEIRVYLNGRIIQAEVILDSNFKGFEIALEKGFNKIDFEALNQGSSGPNTAEFQVYDDKGSLISASRWNLGTGFKATIVLVKE